MDVTITEFRRQLFSLANQALDGEEIWFTHKGRRFRIVPEDQPVSRVGIGVTGGCAEAEL